MCVQYEEDRYCYRMLLLEISFLLGIEKSTEEFVFDQNNLKNLGPFVLWERYCSKWWWWSKDFARDFHEKFFYFFNHFYFKWLSQLTLF